MIRWHSRSEDYSFSNSRVIVSEKNKTQMAVAIPVWGKTAKTEHFCHGDTLQLQGGLRTSFQDGAFGGPVLVRRTSEAERTIRFDRDQAELPLLIAPTTGALLVRRTASAEGFMTGSVNGTTGALAGAGAWMFFGPAGGLLWWMLGGATLVGVSTGVAQTGVTSRSNEMRAFAEMCNDFLMGARAKGIEPETIELFAHCVRQASTLQRRNLVRDILQVCDVCLGRDAAEPLRLAANRMATDLPPYTA